MRGNHVSRIGTALLLALVITAPGPAVAQDLPKARANRLAISLGFGFGSAAMSSFGKFVDASIGSLEAANAGLSVKGDIKSGLQINGEVSFRYYFPYYVMAQVGYGTIYNASSTDFTLGAFTGEVEYHNLAMEVPILVGGYYTLIDRIYLYGAVGPSVTFFGRSYWDAGGQNVSAGLPDFKTDAGVGFTGMGGADFMVGETFAVGVELRYRYLKAKNMVELKHGAAAPGGPYDLDFSGISVGFYLRLFPM